MAADLAWIADDTVQRQVSEALDNQLESWRVDDLLARSEARASELVRKGQEKKKRELTQREQHMTFVEAFCRESTSRSVDAIMFGVHAQCSDGDDAMPLVSHVV